MTWRLGRWGRGKERDQHPATYKVSRVLSGLLPPVSTEKTAWPHDRGTGSPSDRRASVIPAHCATSPRRGPISVIGYCPVSMVSGLRDVFILAPVNVSLVAWIRRPEK